MHSIQSQIIYEDNHLIAVNKQSGQLAQGDATGDTPLPDLLKAYIKEKYQKPGNVFLGVIHRLDRPVTGVCLFARTSKALERMNESFRDRSMEKIYWAMLEKKPVSASGTLKHWLVKDSSKNVVKAFRKEVSGGKDAELDYEFITERDGFYLMKITPRTGRPHQIRVQLASALSPIAGDVKYGSGTTNPDNSICLHARQLNFSHPVTKEPVSITAELPNLKIWDIFKDIP